jgi:DNA methylase
MHSIDWLAPHLKGRISPLYHDNHVALFRGDMREVLPALTSIHNSVCDPPYGIGIMGKAWDKAVPDKSFWSPLHAALRPGAHLLSFWGSRTYHRGTCAIEDGGFEVRDMIEWVYSTGFPKSMDVSKAIDREAKATRKVVATKTTTRAKGGWADMKDSGLFKPGAVDFQITVPATDAAKQWAGWGTTLKPAHEPITVARKALEGTVAAHVRRHCNGCLNIDKCRIGGGELRHVNAHKANGKGKHLSGLGTRAAHTTTLGRFPANVIHDGSAEVINAFEATPNGIGAQRFFYVAKPGPKERAGNDHPTVKPIALMRHLIRLTCVPGTVMIDPFGGSGTSGIAARMEGVRCILIEQDKHNCQTIIKRLKAQAAEA